MTEINTRGGRGAKSGIRLNIAVNYEMATDAQDDKVKWIDKGNGLYIAENRGVKTKQGLRVLAKEEAQARILADLGHTVYLIPEKGSGKHYDAIVDGKKFEMKTVTGNENTFSHRFREALRQGDNVYLRVRSEVTPKRARELIKGVLKTKERTGLIYSYFDKTKTMYKWEMKDLK